MNQQKIEITRLNHTGEGIGTLDGKIIFVSKAIPGDVIIPNEIKDHGNYLQTTIQKIDTLSPKRQTISCPYYEKCGGCHLLGLSYQNQLSYKQEKVKNILQKYASISVNPDIVEGESFYYRNKITLQVKNGRIGLYEINSNNLVPIKQCLLVTKPINQLLLWLVENLKETELKKVKQIVIRETSGQVMIQFLGYIDLKDKINVLLEKTNSIYVNDKLIAGLPKIEEHLGNYVFAISPNSFFQVNHNQTIKLYDQAKEYLGTNNNRILDLYCGTGTIGIYVSEGCNKITGIEVNSSSVADARMNIQRNNLKNIQVLEGKVENHLTTGPKYDAIIVDPPRSGLDKKTKKLLTTIKSPKIIYISCDPITLARDIRDLEQEYQLEKIKLIDMFPNTYHVECVTWLSLKK